MVIRELLMTLGVKMDEASFNKANASMEKMKKNLVSLEKNANTTFSKLKTGFTTSASTASTSMGKIGTELSNTSRVAKTSMNSVKKSVEKTTESTNGLVSSFKSMIGALATIYTVRTIGQMADSWNEINARIGIVTSSIGEQKEIQREVFNIAQNTRQEYDATGTLFVRMARFSGELGASQQDVLDVTKTVNRALVVGGASAQEARSTILQLSQSLASGRLQGDELRSLNEAAPQLMDLVAKYFKVTVGQLKKMGSEGKLLSKDIFAAILSGRDKMAKEFEKMPITFGQAFDIMKNYVGQLFFEMNRETGIFQDLAHGAVNAIKSITEAAKSGIKRLNGWGNALKFAAGGIGAVVLGVKAFNLAMLATERNVTILALLSGGVKTLTASLWALLANPITWWAVGVSIAVAAIALALEDLYTWITGGESVIGSFLGSWEDLTNGMGKAWDDFSKWFDDLMHMRVIDVIDLAISKLADFGEAITFAPWETLKGVGNYLSGAITTEEVGLTQMQREAYGITNSTRSSAVSQNNDIKITQNIAGTSADIVSDIGKATSSAFDDSTNKFARDITYSINGGEGY